MSFFFQAEAGIRDGHVTGVQTCALPIFDAWYDSGSMPFAQFGYPWLEGSEAQFEERFPADFIFEGVDQTRGWFYSLMARSEERRVGKGWRGRGFPLRFVVTRPE